MFFIIRNKYIHNFIVEKYLKLIEMISSIFCQSTFLYCRVKQICNKIN